MQGTTLHSFVEVDHSAAGVVRDRAKVWVREVPQKVPVGWRQEKAQMSGGRSRTGVCSMNDVPAVLVANLDAIDIDGKHERVRNVDVGRGHVHLEQRLAVERQLLRCTKGQHSMPRGRDTHL